MCPGGQLKIGSWKTESNSRHPHSSLGDLTPDDHARQWQVASLSVAKSMTADQPCQSDPDGLRFTQALTGPHKHRHRRECEGAKPCDADQRHLFVSLLFNYGLPITCLQSRLAH